jgi:hypothetical protein
MEILSMLVVRTEWQDNPRPIDDGTMVVAIGDVHGCSKHLELMYKSIADDIETLESRKDYLYFDWRSY